MLTMQVNPILMRDNLANAFKVKNKATGASAIEVDTLTGAEIVRLIATTITGTLRLNGDAVIEQGHEISFLGYNNLAESFSINNVGLAGYEFTTLRSHGNGSGGLKLLSDNGLNGLYLSDGEIVLYNSVLNAANSTIAKFGGAIGMTGIASPLALALNSGHLWVRDDEPYSLMYTDADNNTLLVMNSDLEQVTGWPVGVSAMAHTSFTDGTRTFNLHNDASAYYYLLGKKVPLVGDKTVVITDTEGGWFIYFDDATGVLKASQTPWSILANDKVLVGYIHWSVAQAKHIINQYELHKIRMEATIHDYLHNTRKAAFASGLLAAEVASEQIDIASGVIYDEDIRVNIVDDDTPDGYSWQQILSPAQAPIYIRSGASNWIQAGIADKVRPADVAYVFVDQVGYNSVSVGVWSVDFLGSNEHAAMWLVASSDITYPCSLIMGQRKDTTEASAKASNNWAAMDLSGFPAAEYVLLARIIIKKVAGAPYYSVVEVLDMRSATSGGNVITGIGNHNSLTGLQGGDAGPSEYYHLTLADYNDIVNDNFVKLAGRANDKITMQDSATIAPLNMTPRSTPPSNPAIGDVYEDDGTNTTNLSRGFRQCVGLGPVSWVDVGVDGTAIHLNKDSEITTLDAATALADTDVVLMETAAGVKKKAPASLFPSIPAFATDGCRVKLTSNFSLNPRLTWTTLPFNNVDYDVGGNFNTGTYRFVVPSTGYWMLSVQAQWNGAGWDGYVRSTRLLKNGTTTIIDLANGIDGGAVNAVPANAWTIAYLTAGDYIEGQCYSGIPNTASVYDTIAADSEFVAYKIAGSGIVYPVVNRVTMGTKFETLIIKNNVTNPTYQVDIDAASMLLDNGTDLIRVSNVNLTVDLTAGVGANGLDAGVEEASKFYYLWVAYKESTNSLIGILSLSPSNPDWLAANGYDYKQFVGAVRNDADQNLLKQYQLGDWVIYDDFMEHDTPNVSVSTTPGSKDFSHQFPAASGKVKSVLFGADEAFGVWIKASASSGAYQTTLLGTASVDIPVATTGETKMQHVEGNTGTFYMDAGGAAVVRVREYVWNF